MLKFKWRNLNLEVELDDSLPITSFYLTLDTGILINHVSSTYWRPFSSYHQSNRRDVDMKIPFRETNNPNEYCYYLNYLLKSPNAPKNIEIKIRANNLLYVFHDLLHCERDVIGDTMSVSRETEAQRFEEALFENLKQGFPSFGKTLLDKIIKMFEHDQVGEKNKVKLNLYKYEN